MSIDAMKQVLEALGQSIEWQKAALECKDWQWDSDQRETAQGSLGYAIEQHTNLRAAITEAAQQEPVEFLANATRYKICRTDELGCHIAGLPNDLHGRWVALVAAEDGKHLKLTATQPAIPDGWLKEMPDILREASDILAEEKCMRFPIIDELRGFAAMLAAAPKEPK